MCLLRNCLIWQQTVCFIARVKLCVPVYSNFVLNGGERWETGRRGPFLAVEVQENSATYADRNFGQIVTHSNNSLYTAEFLKRSRFQQTQKFKLRLYVDSQSLSEDFIYFFHGSLLKSKDEAEEYANY